MNITYPVQLTGNVILGGAFSVSGSLDTQRSFSLDGSIVISTFNKDSDHYEGSYTFTPTDTEQIIPTYNLVMDDNITINPIPSNYGLITWDGSTLTVS